jgi:hypothetical protein
LTQSFALLCTGKSFYVRGIWQNRAPSPTRWHCQSREY